MSFEVMPIFMIRLVEDSGGIMKGGAAHVGRVLVASAIRSLDQLPCADLVDAGLEDQHDRRQLRHRLRPHHVDVRGRR